MAVTERLQRIEQGGVRWLRQLLGQGGFIAAQGQLGEYHQLRPACDCLFDAVAVTLQIARQVALAGGQLHSTQFHGDSIHGESGKAENTIGQPAQATPR